MFSGKPLPQGTGKKFLTVIGCILFLNGFRVLPAQAQAVSQTQPGGPSLPNSASSSNAKPAYSQPQSAQVASSQQAAPSQKNASSQQALPQTPQSSETQSAQSPTLTEPPEGTLGPVTLKAALEKTQTLPLTLEQALQLAQGQGITLKIAIEQTLLQRESYLSNLVTLLPNLIATHTQSRLVGATQVFGGAPYTVYRTTIQPQLSANYTIYTGGESYFLIRASKKLEDAQRQMAEYTRQQLLTQVGTSYYDLQKAYWQKAIALRAIQDAQAVVDLDLARIKAGVGVQLDLVQAQTTLATNRQNLVLGENAVALASNHLSQLLNMDFKVDIVPEALEGTTHTLVPATLDTSAMLRITKAQNPQFRSYINQLDAGKYNVKAAIADFFPQININGYINETGPTWDKLGLSRFGGVQLYSNLFSNLGFAKPLALRIARANRSIASLNLQLLDRQLEESLADAIVNVASQAKQITLAQQTLQLAQAQYNLAYGQLRAGVGTNLNVETALAALEESRFNLANAFLTYNQDEILLLSWLGVTSIDTLVRGFDPQHVAGAVMIPHRIQQPVLSP